MALYEKKLGYGDLKKIVGNGETVLHRGRAIRDVDTLPSPVELAGNDIVAKQQAVGDIDAQIRALQQQKAAAEKATRGDAGSDEPQGSGGDKDDDEDKGEGGNDSPGASVGGEGGVAATLRGRGRPPGIR